MAVYAIGDVQGCYKELKRLLDRLKLDSSKDEVWFVGDLVNRGPQSLKTLRLIRTLGDMAVVTLGNHDLHLLALALAGKVPVSRGDLGEILDAPDRDELIDWLRRRPLAHYRPDLNTLMVHAGIPPQWDPLQTVRCAREVEQVLRGDGAGKFLGSMYGARPNLWDPGLRGLERLRFITNCLTRIRFVHTDGRLDFVHKGKPDTAPAGVAPWFDMPGRASESVRIVFGHWSTLGLVQRPGLLGLDTGCVWGGTLTAARLTGPMRIVFEQSPGYRKPKVKK
jgi:bis(5'-nucleosyl)-tetraphosphatase (symmetrical)